MMKRLKYIVTVLFGASLAIAGSVYATQISVPSAPGANYILVSTSTGAYIASSTPYFANGLTGSLTGNASSATKLLNARTINGVSFDGTGNITITAASSTLLGDANIFSGIDKFTNASSDFSGTWQTFSPSHFATFAYPFPAGATTTLVTFTNATSTLFSSTYASSTNYFGANLASCTGTSALTWSAGFFGCTAVPQGTVTSVTGTYPVQSTGGATPVVSLAFGTTTANTWSQLQILTSGLISQASSTIGNGSQIGGLTVSGGATTTGFITVQGTGTSTFSGGINLNGTDCFAIAGTCLQTFIQNATAYKQAVSYATAAVLAGTPTYNNGSSGVGATLTEVGTGALSVDGQAPSAGQRILVRNQADQTQNGIYVVTATGSGIASYILTRATDYNTSNDIYAGTTVPVLVGGTANGDTQWTESTTGTIVVGTSNIAFIETSYGTSGTVTSIATNNGLTGGTITTSGTIGLATINAGVLGAQANGSVPTSQATSSLYGTGTGGQVLTWNNGVPQWVATTTYASGAGISTSFVNGQLTITNTGASFSYPFPVLGIGTTTGLMITASSTIGNGFDGLTVSGYATTTQGLSVAGDLFRVGAAGTITRLNGNSINISSSAIQLSTTGDVTVQNNSNSAASGLKLQGGNGSGALNNAGNHINFFPGANQTASFTGNGLFGFGTTSPYQAIFAINTPGGATGATTTLFMIASSTASATTTLFQVDNVGTASTTGLRVSNTPGCSGTNALTTDSSGLVLCGAISGTGSSFAYPFPNNATSTALTFSGGIFTTNVTGSTNSLTLQSASNASSILIGDNGEIDLNTSGGRDVHLINGSGYDVQFDTTLLTGNQSYAFPNTSGTFCLTTTCANFTYPFPSSATSSVLTFSQGIVSNGSTTIAGLTSGLVGNNNGKLYGFATSSLFGFIPAPFPFTAQTGGNATGTPIYFNQGFVSAASSTFSSLSQGIAYVGSGNVLQTVSTSSPLNTAITGNAGTATALAGNGTNCSAGFYPLGIDASGNVETCTYVLATTTPWSTGLMAIGSAGTAYTLSSSTLFGYTPPSNATQILTTFPLQGGGDLTANRTLTSAFSTTSNSGMTAGNLYVGSGGIFQTAASSSIFGFTPVNPTRALTVAGTANQITSSAGSQDLSADRTWTLSLPNHVIFPAGGFEAAIATITNATTTNFAMTGAAANCNTTSALTTNSSGVVGCTAQPQGTVTNVTATFPLSSTGGATPVLSSLFSTTTNSGMSGGSLYVGSGGILQVVASSTIFGPIGAPGQVLMSSNGIAVWAATSSAAGSTNAGGTNGQFQYNNGGTAFGGIANSTFQSTGGWFSFGTSTLNLNTAPALGIFGTSSAPQLLLTDNLNAQAPWAFRAISGNLYFATSSVTTFATSTNAALFLSSGGQLSTLEQKVATTSNMQVDWLATPNQVLVNIGTAAQTIGFNNASTSGMTKRILVCNPNATAGALTWAAAIMWVGTTGAPGQTTTANVCDLYTFVTTMGTSTSGAVEIIGTEAANIP